MTAHELAKMLLSLPDVPVVTGLDRSGYGEPVLVATLIAAHPYSNDEDGYAEGTEQVVDLTISDASTHSSFVGLG